MTLSLINNSLTVIDYAYVDETGGVRGDSLLVDVSLQGHTDQEGVIFDFSKAKKLIKKIIDEKVDHTLVISKSLVKEESKERYCITNKKFHYSAPKEAFCVLDVDIITDEALRVYLERELLKQMTANIKNVAISLRRESDGENKYYFNYTHGLKDHYGNCQRLIHGHRSTIRVFKNEKRDFNLEADLFSMIGNSTHFAYWKNVANRDDILSKINQNHITNIEGRLDIDEQVNITYVSSQGEYQGVFDLLDVYFLNEETTIENLSIHFAKKLYATTDQKDQIMVYISEGIGKGASFLVSGNS